jgi:hypothetical protein
MWEVWGSKLGTGFPSRVRTHPNKFPGHKCISPHPLQFIEHIIILHFCAAESVATAGVSEYNAFIFKALIIDINVVSS